MEVEKRRKTRRSRKTIDLPDEVVDYIECNIQLSVRSSGNCLIIGLGGVRNWYEDAPHYKRLEKIFKIKFTEEQAVAINRKVNSHLKRELKAEQKARSNYINKNLERFGDGKQYSDLVGITPYDL